MPAVNRRRGDVGAFAVAIAGLGWWAYGRFRPLTIEDMARPDKQLDRLTNGR